MITVVGVTTASATTITDPIVRTRGGGTGSYQIFELPYSFNFGTFPTDPDALQENIDRGQGQNCIVGIDTGTISNPGTGLPMVSCEFQNLTGQTISLLDFQFSIFGDTTGLEFNTQSEPVNLWDSRTINVLGAQFVGGGIASGVCFGEIDVFCEGGDFGIDLIGFPAGSNVTMIASAVPEPASLMLLGTGLGLGAAFMSKRKRAR